MAESLLQLLLPADAVAIALGLALAVGGLASSAWLQARGSAWAARTSVQARGARRLGFVLGLAALVLAPVLEAMSVSDEPLSEAAGALATLMRHTHYGHAALVGLAAWLAAGGLVLLPANAADVPPRRAAGLATVAAFIVTRSVVSHAGAHGDASVAVVLDALHLAAACLWVGIVLAGARLVLPPESATGGERADAAHWVARMSATAALALFLLVATGAVKAWQALEGAETLSQAAGSAYGRTLAAKLGLAAIAALLGGINRFAVLPALDGRRPAARAGDGARWRHRLVVILRAEALVLLLVLGVAALLAGTEPPASS
jgi:putative copper resistance protein D